ncbi:unnamed protein product [Psylliodes chrysocephalus]|uniref:Uncharacterized protein n=1 Tax=Psylliodes chrysocephalus TaxID=3402493 RepID=A0A9P0DA54_9CUCU|nr:unnamed protein product [Psylliodes chrysocephala]
MVMAGVDAKETTKLINKTRRLKKMQQRKELHKKVCSENDTKLTLDIKPNIFSKRTTNIPVSSSHYLDTTCEQPSTSKELAIPRNTIKLPTLAKVCDRYGLSDRSAAAVATAVLQEVGIVTKESSVQIINKNKLRRARKYLRTKIINLVDCEPITAMYFDGRKDKTLSFEEIDGKSRKRTVTEEDISLVQELGSVFLGHTIPSSGSAKNLCQIIVDFLQENNHDLSSLLAVGSDGTVVSTQD